MDEQVENRLATLSLDTYATQKKIEQILATIFTLLTSRQFITGMTAGAVKG